LTTKFKLIKHFARKFGAGLQLYRH